MPTVGVRELKAHLSQYIRLAKQGERIVITERGQEVAELQRITPIPPGIKDLMDRGIVRWSGGKPGAPSKPMKIRGGPISDTVVELRNESLR